MSDLWLKTTEEKLRSLIADEAKLMPMLTNMEATIRQMKAKQAFRLALLNQLLEEHYDKYSGNQLKGETNETITNCKRTSISRINS